MSSSVATSGRREADGLAVRLLGEDALAEQSLADLTAGGDAAVDVDAGPQAADAHGVEAVADQGGRARRRGGRRARGARCWNSPVCSIATTSRPMAAASGLPPNVEPWLPGVITSSTSRSAAIAETG